MTNPPKKKKLVVNTYSLTHNGLLKFEEDANLYLQEGYEVKCFSTNSKQVIVLYQWMEKTYTVAESALGFDEVDVG